MRREPVKPILIVMLGLFVAFAFVAFAGDKNPQSGMTSSQTHFAFRPRPAYIWQNAQVK
jgi:hypothetical protein